MKGAKAAVRGLVQAVEGASELRAMAREAVHIAERLARPAIELDDAVALWLLLKQNKSLEATRAREAILRAAPAALRERIGKRWKAAGLAYRVVVKP